jgi:hypothetical protein
LDGLHLADGAPLALERCLVAVAASPEMACLSLRRKTWRRAEQMTIVHQLFVGSDYDLTAWFGTSSA